MKAEVKSIYRKLGASSRNQAITRARELGLMEGRDPSLPSCERCNPTEHEVRWYLMAGEVDDQMTKRDQWVDVRQADDKPRV
jgi:hypothetical protein